MATSETSASSNTRHRRKNTVSTVDVEPAPHKEATPQPTVEARIDPPLQAASTSVPSVVAPVIEDAEPAASDGFYRGTVVTCRHESNVPGDSSRLCVDIGGKNVSVAAVSNIYILVGGWNRRIPLYPGDVIKFEVRGGALTRAELISDPRGR